MDRHPMHAAPTPSPGEQALEVFAAGMGAGSAEEGVVRACENLRDRITSLGRAPRLENYLQAFGIDTFEAPIANPGRLDVRDGRYVILVQHRSGGLHPTRPLSLCHASNRQRFSVAHELGHVLLIERLAQHPQHLTALRGPDIWDQVESLCDLAAAELLVPIESFVARVSRDRLRISDIHQLANEFRVSRDVILRRFLAAGARAVVVWKVPNGSTGRGWRGSARKVCLSGSGPPIGRLDDTGGLKPDVVQRAVHAKLGWARSSSVTFSKGRACWELSGIAIAEPIVDVGPTEAQLDLLGLEWESRRSRIKSLKLALEAGELIVLLFLLPGPAPSDPASLWHVLQPR